MKQNQFEKRHKKLWQDIESLLGAGPKGVIESKKWKAKRRDFPQKYRQICAQLAVARDRNYSVTLIQKLENLTLRSHQLLYGARGGAKVRVIKYFLNDFPALIRKEWKMVFLSCVLLFGFMGLMIYISMQNPHIPYMILGEDSLSRIESMYDPGASHFGEAREAESDIMMWAHYINNNIGIDFACFASGIFVGIGSIFFMVFNGLYIGLIAGHLTNAGCSSTFWPFVSGHSALELFAAALSGAAGMKMGLSLLMPGRRTRVHAFKEDSIVAAKILYGAATMTFLAAFIEAFWSSRVDLTAGVKYGFGGFMWLIVFWYFGFCGRNDVTE